MTEILCRWLNEDVRLEPKLSGSSFAEQFSNGYLFGEVLHKHGLQNNFARFSRGMSSEAKLNNFMMLEPTFKLLDIPFDVNMARDIMTEKPGVATKLMYQLFVSLNRKKQRKLTGQSIECMRPSGKVKLEKIETGIFQERLKRFTPRQVDLNFEGLIHKFQDRQRQHEELVARERQVEEERLQRQRKDLCHQSLEKSKQVREGQAQMYAKLKPISGTAKSPRTTTSPDTKQTHTKRSRVRTRLIAAQTRASIEEFEASISKREAPPTSDGDPRPFTTGSAPDDGSKAVGVSPVARQVVTADYVSDIKRRVHDSNAARSEREKRRRKVLIDQMKALQEQENIKREKMLVERLMRQCQQERRIATQLLNIRKEKDVIRNNRITRQKQYEEQRMREFEGALNREAELAKQEETAKKESLKFHQELYKHNLVLKAREHCQRSYHVCQIMLLHMVDFATKLSRYKEMAQGLVPAKLVNDWKTLFIAGLPLDDGGDEKNLANLSSLFSSQMTTGSITSFKPQTADQILNDTDFNEYKTATAEWAPTDDLNNELPSPTNSIVAHAVYRVLDTVDPPKDRQKASYLPNFLLRSAIVGRPFSGKTTVFQHLKKTCGIYVLNTDELVQKAINTYLTEKRLHENESVSAPTEEATPVIPGDNEGETPIIQVDNKNLQPAISVEPSSSVQMMTPSTNSPEVKMVAAKEDDVDGFKSTSAVSVDVIAQYTPMAQLGFKAHSLMMTGEPLDDPLLVEIIIQELKSLPENSMWMLDNFPSSLDQGLVMAMALSGTTSRPTPTLPREFVLLGEREPEMVDFMTVDMILHFDCSTENVMKRAIELDPSPSSQKLQHIEQRITAFDENWKPLKRLINRYKACKTIDANRNIKTVCKEVEGIVRDIVNRAKISAAMKKIGAVNLSGTTSTGSSSDLSSVPTSKSDPTVSSKPTKATRRKRRPSSAEGLGGLRKQGASTVAGTHPDDKNATAPDIPGPSSNVNPGSPGWKYCDLPLSMELAEGVARRWPAIEETYIRSLKGVFHLLRGEKECIYRYFYQRRTEFAGYLHRPDQKQEFVTQWQINYNSVSAHLRWEDDMKAELHHRVDDLCDKLWDICDHRREQAEQERQRIVGDQWIEDHIGLLTNQYISLMQIELDRCQDTLLLLNDYYDAMDAKMPSNLPDNSRLPFIQLTPASAMDVPPSAISSAHSMQQPSTETGQDQEEEEKKEVDERPKTGSRPKTGQRAPSPSPPAPQRKVPILPRQPPAQEPVEDKGAKKKGPPSPQPPVEDLSGMGLDEQLVVHAYNTAIAGIFHLVQPTVKSLETTITAGNRPSSPKQAEPEKPPSEPIKEEKGGKGKNAKKAKSPAAGKKNKGSPGKAGKGAPPPDPPPEASAATVVPKRTSMDVTKRRQRVLMCREHKAAVEMEEKRAKLQIQLIKNKALLQIENIKSKGQTMHENMEQWIDKCYKQEVAGVSNLADVIRQAIENEEKLLSELALVGVQFQIEESVMMYQPSPPSPPPPLIERPAPNQFMVYQLTSLYHQLMGVAPSGYIMVKSLVETMMNFADKAAGGDLLPEEWKTMTKEQVELMCESVYGAGVDFVDWKRFMVCVAQPWPLPTAWQLVEAMQAFAERSGGGRCVTKEQYEAARIWLDSGCDQVADGEFDRSTAMKQLFYAVFSDPSTNQLDYRVMLFYLCADPQPNEGILKALSVAVGRDLSQQNEQIDPEVIVLLEDFYQILTHSVHKESSSESPTVVTKSDLLEEVFLPLSPSNPNEVPATALLTNSIALHYTVASSIGYSLPDLSQILRPPSRQTETE